MKRARPRRSRRAAAALVQVFFFAEQKIGCVYTVPFPERERERCAYRLKRLVSTVYCSNFFNLIWFPPLRFQQQQASLSRSRGYFRTRSIRTPRESLETLLRTHSFPHKNPNGIGHVLSQRFAQASEDARVSEFATSNWSLRLAIPFQFELERDRVWLWTFFESVVERKGHRPPYLFETLFEKLAELSLSCGSFQRKCKSRPCRWVVGEQQLEALQRRPKITKVSFFFHSLRYSLRAL